MKMSGTRQLPAAQADVWSALNDVEVLKRCIPGCQSLEKVSDDQLKATVGLKIGPINAKFNGEVTLSDMNPPNSYRISGSGKGGAAGSASGGADVKLEAKDGGTELSYDVDAKVAGKIAQLGARLIDATAANLANKFFDNLAAEFGATEAATATPTEASAAATSSSGAAPAPAQQSKPASANSGGTSYIWWIIGGIIVIGAVWYFTR
ncbi:MAG: carbon monoxide dehydrogenase subunit G [Pseudomonadota bacterium]